MDISTLPVQSRSSVYASVAIFFVYFVIRVDWGVQPALRALERRVFVV